MSSLVIKLQRDILNTDISLSTLLRSALLISSKLNLKDIEDWISVELYGYYKKRTAVPDYRRISGWVKGFNDNLQVWFPIDFSYMEDIEMFTTYPFNQSVSEIEALLDNNQAEKLFAFYPPEMTKTLKQVVEGTRCDNIAFQFTKTQLHGILNHVKNVLLEWTIKLEKQGILGNDVEFTNEEIKKANNVVINNFYKDVIKSQINSSSDKSTLDN